MAKTYSFKDVVAVFVHPLVGSYTIRGQVGIKSLSIDNTTERTVHDVAADGTVMISYVAGDNASIAIEMQQNSDFHKFLLSWYNIIKTLADQDDVSAWAAAEMHIRTISAGDVHNVTGISPAKNPPKAYGAQGASLTWNLMAGNAAAS